MPEVVEISDDEMSEDNRSHCVEDTDSQEDEDYNPISSGSISEEADYSDSNEGESVDHSDKEEAEDELPSNSDIGVEDEVLEDTELDEDQMSDAASFEFDNEFMADGAADEESDSKHRPSKQMRGVPFRVGRNEQIKLEVGQLFQNLQHFRQVIRDFAVQDGFQLRRVKNERDRYTAECAYEGCGWRIHASPIDDRKTFMIKTLQPEHSCLKLHKNQEATAVWVASRFKELIESNPDIEVKFLGNEIHRIYGLTLPVWTLYRAKHRVLDKTDVVNCKSYSMLYKYGRIIMEQNPGSLVKVKTVTPVPDGPTMFLRLFVSFKAQKEGFLNGCRPLLGLDACYLKGKFPGVLMSAIGIDANNGVFPVAWCVAEGESKQSWGWFLELLHLHLELDESRRLTFISDRQKGVLDAVELFWPRSTNRFCVRHIIANMQSKWKGQLNGIYMWDAANKSNKVDFLEEIEKLKTVCVDAYNYVMRIPLHSWCMHAFDTNVKSAHTTNNITESFNGWVDELRALPALHLMEAIRRKLMKRSHNRLVRAKQWPSSIPPKIQKTIAKRQDEGRFVTALCSTETLFEVKEGSKFYVVDLEKQSCDCGLWEVTGIPCKHAMAVITTKRLNSHDYVHKYLTKEYYLKTYSHAITPIPDQSLWPDDDNPSIVLPPEKKRMPGRPKKNRKRGTDEGPKHKKSAAVRCKGCGEFGHNIRTCEGRVGSTSTKTVKGQRRQKIGVAGGSKSALNRNKIIVTGSSTNNIAVGGSSNVVMGPSSQQVSQTAPLHASQPASQSEQVTRTSINRGNVPGLDVDWNGL
ncbi:hypothetical protein ACOSQ2_006920 [Xanthoceras sorbifolium]